MIITWIYVMSELQLNDFTILSQYQQNFTTIFRYDILIKVRRQKEILENEENKMNTENNDQK